MGDVDNGDINRGDDSVGDTAYGDVNRGDDNGNLMGDTVNGDPSPTPTDMNMNAGDTAGDSGAGGCISDDLNMNDSRAMAEPLGTVSDVSMISISPFTTCNTDPDWYAFVVDGSHRARITLSYGLMDNPTLGRFKCSDGVALGCVEGGGAGMSSPGSWTCTTPPGPDTFCLSVASSAASVVSYGIFLEGVP